MSSSIRCFGSMISTRLWAPRSGSRRIEMYTAALHQLASVSDGICMATHVINNELATYGLRDGLQEVSAEREPAGLLVVTADPHFSRPPMIGVASRLGALPTTTTTATTGNCGRIHRCRCFDHGICHAPASRGIASRVMPNDARSGTIQLDHWSNLRASSTSSSMAPRELERHRGSSLSLPSKRTSTFAL